MLDNMRDALEKLRASKPVVLCLTNYVTMDFIANSLLALGAAPIMSSDSRELEELVKISGAINLNIGTLSPAFIEDAQITLEFAKEYQKPVILDPVGAGASKIRTASAARFMKYAEVIRGNASEVIALFNATQDSIAAKNNIQKQAQRQSMGVESVHSVNDAASMAKNLAVGLKNCISVSGPQDWVTDGVRCEILKSGSSTMQLVTGIGCAVTSVIAAFRAVIPDSFEAIKIAMLYFGLCGNLADARSQKPGSFRMHFIDALYEADFHMMRQFYVERTQYHKFFTA